MNSFAIRQEMARCREETVFKSNCETVSEQNYNAAMQKLFAMNGSEPPTMREHIRMTAQSLATASALFGIEKSVLEAKLRKLENDLKVAEAAETAQARELGKQ